MFENTEDFSFLLNLEILKIEYKPNKIFYKILENSKNIKELHLLEHDESNCFNESEEESHEKEENEENNKYY